MSARDPFEDLALPDERQRPRDRFARELRARLRAELGIDDDPPTIPLPERRSTMSTTSPNRVHTATITPYLTSADAAAAIEWYTTAFGAEEQFRVVADDGVVGHAELVIAGARFMLSDEHPALGVLSPRTLGGTPAALHLDVDDVDGLFARAAAAGATVLQEPADQPHGARHGTLLDPDGHRWMLSQQLEQLSVDDYAARSQGSGYRVEKAGEPYRDGIWAVVSYHDPFAGIRFLVDVLGFEEHVVVTAPDDPSTIVHSELRWPDGGIVQVAGHDPDNPFLHAPGDESLYVVTPDPWSVWERCQAAGVEVMRAPEEPHYDPGGMGFTVKDPDGNIWSVGSYAGGATG